MARYWNWVRFRFVGDRDLCEKFVAEGRQYLGQLEDEMKHGLTKTVSRRVTNSLGVIFVVSFFMGQPIIEINVSAVTKNPCPSCDIYMESGVLDLGENSESDVRLQPVVDDTVSTLYFGDNTRCDGKRPEGKLSVFVCDDGRTSLDGGCQAGSEDDPVTSIESTCLTEVLDDDDVPIVTLLEKKICQARLQPSLWTGKMHRWVQAQYGYPKAIYKCATFTDSFSHKVVPHLQVLAADGETWVDIYYALYNGSSGDLGTWGLIFLVDKYYFVKAAQEDATLYATTLTECGKKLLKVMQGMPTDTEEKKQEKERVESYLFTQLGIDLVEPKTVTYTTAVEGYPLCYGWKFNPRAAEMAMVTVTGTSAPQATLHKRTFEIDPDDATAVIVTEQDEDPENMSLLGGILGAIAVPYLDNRTSTDGAFRGFTGNFSVNSIGGPQTDFDSPIYCWYLRDGTLEVVRTTLTVGSTSTYTPDACWGDYPTAGYPNLSTSCAVNNPCLFTSEVTYNAMTVGFYTARATCVAVTSFGTRISGGGFKIYNENLNGISYTSSWDTADRDQFWPVTPPSPTTVPSGASPSMTFTWSMPLQGCEFGSDSTTAHGCPIYVGSSSASAVGYGLVDVVCPDQGLSPLGHQYYTHDTAIPSTTMFHMINTYSPQLGLFRKKDGGWSTRDTNSALLIVPAGSASAATLVNEVIHTFSGSSSAVDTYYLCDTTVHSEFEGGPFTCFYDTNGATVETTTAVGDISFSAAADVHSTCYGCCISLQGWGFAVDEDQVFPELVEDPTFIGRGGGGYGVEAVSGTLLGFDVATVIAITDADGSMADPDVGITGAFADYAPSECMPMPSNTYEDQAQNPILTIAMDTGNTWPADAVDMSIVAGSDATTLVARSSIGISAAFFVHTSLSGDIMYFDDWPALRWELADNNLVPTGGYPTIERVSFVGWA